jgi:protein TonB
MYVFLFALLLSSLAPAQTVDHPLKADASVTPPVLTRQVDPKMTRAMRKHPQTVVVMVSFVVDQQGTPVNLSVARSDDQSFDKSALDAVSKYRFNPALKDGEAVAVYMNVVVNFEIK